MKIFRLVSPSQSCQTKSFSTSEKLQKVFGTDQPGRWLAVLVLAPIIILKGIKFRDIFLIIFAIALFVWNVLFILVGHRATKDTVYWT